jgi:transposase-like protein
VGRAVVRGISNQLSSAEEMMQERLVEVDHSTLNQWMLKYVPLLD